MSTESPPKSDPVIDAYKQHVDVSLIRRNLRLSVEQRIENLVRRRPARTMKTTSE